MTAQVLLDPTGADGNGMAPADNDPSPAGGDLDGDAKTDEDSTQPGDGAQPGGDTDQGGGDGPIAPCSFTFGSMAISPPAGSAPGAGQTVVIPETGISVRRISNVQDPGVTQTEFTNGYSRWSPANVTGEYVTAFGTSGSSAVYKLSDRSIVRLLNISEPNEMHWDTSGAAGTTTRIYYVTGTQLRQVEILTGTDTLVHDFKTEYPSAGGVRNDVEGAPSRDARYWAFMVCTSAPSGGGCSGLIDIITYDKQADTIIGRIKDIAASPPTPNFVDIAPNGDRVVLSSAAGGSGVFAGPHAFDLNFQNATQAGDNTLHSGWAWGPNGEELFVTQCDDDYVAAVDVNAADGWAKRIKVLDLNALGGLNLHIGRIYDSSIRGWAFMSTFGTKTTWPTNQLFFFELVPWTSNPRIWRITHTINVKVGYWSEAFASLDVQAQNIYWGANWNNTTNLELYQAALCPQWWASVPPR